MRIMITAIFKGHDSLSKRHLRQDIQDEGGEVYDIPEDILQQGIGMGGGTSPPPPPPPDEDLPDEWSDEEIYDIPPGETVYSLNITGERKPSVQDSSNAKLCCSRTV